MNELNNRRPTFRDVKKTFRQMQHEASHTVLTNLKFTFVPGNCVIADHGGQYSKI